MPIRVDEIRISGLRGLHNLEMKLAQITVLFGTNNSGKTSIIKALQLALGDYSRYLSAEDFHIDAEDQRATQIMIDVRIVPTDASSIRTKNFEEEWIHEFGEGIRADAETSQFHAIRTIVRPDSLKGGFIVERFVLDQWPQSENWWGQTGVARTAHKKRYELIPFISIDAQRDIHQELNEKTSFVGRILSSIEYTAEDVANLEGMVAEINRQAVEKSLPLSSLKQHLDSLKDSFGGTGVAEVTPFPKKIRDLSKRFSVHFGNTVTSSFSMEYHGMGTRSWASMLAVKAFSSMQANKHLEEVNPYHPIIAAEEPEAHLHPNAQRALFKQLSESVGQIIISTHSPYLAGMCDLESLRSISGGGAGKKCMQLSASLDREDKNILHREVMRSRGEVLFARAVIVFEGATEEQIFPAMFECFFGEPAFVKGVTFIGVGGKNYTPFIKLLASFGIPIYIVSDNDRDTFDNISAQIDKIPQDTKNLLNDNTYGISFLGEGNDIEAELISAMHLREEVIEALLVTETRGSDNERWCEAKRVELSRLTNDELILKMRASKTSYSANLAQVILNNPRALSVEQIVPAALQDAFRKISQWLN